MNFVESGIRIPLLIRERERSTSAFFRDRGQRYLVSIAYAPGAVDAAFAFAAAPTAAIAIVGRRPVIVLCERAMLRRAVQTATLRHAVKRNYAAATSAKKRALAKDQLGGTAETTSKPTSGTPPPPPPSSESSSSMLPVAAVGLVAAGGAAYYFDLIPGLSKEELKQDATKVEEKVQATTKEVEAKASAAATKVEEEVTKVVKEVEEKASEVAGKVKEEASALGNRVKSIHVPSTKRSPAEAPPPVEHPASGNRVSMKPQPSSAPSAAEAANELAEASMLETSATLAKAHRALRASFDETLFNDIENMSAPELRIRLIQLATEMEDRTKWEAVRLNEFLSMKEKETAEK